MPSTGLIRSDTRPAPARGVRLAYDDVRGRHVLLAPESVIVLNATGAAIVGMCDGQHTVADIVTILSGLFDRVAVDDVTRFLDRLTATGCLERRGD